MTFKSYKKRKKNVVAYALSRKNEYVEALLCTISIIQSDWITKARDEWKNDEEVWTLIQNLVQDPNISDTIFWKIASLWYKDRLEFPTQTNELFRIAHIPFRRALEIFKNLPQGQERTFLG